MAPEPDRDVVPPSPTLMGLIWMFHVPGVRNGSQLALTGVVWFQTIMTNAIDVAAVKKMRAHNAAF